MIKFDTRWRRATVFVHSYGGQRYLYPPPARFGARSSTVLAALLSGAWWQEGRGLIELLQRFAGRDWNCPEILLAAYERDVASVVPRRGRIG